MVNEVMPRAVPELERIHARISALVTEADHLHQVVGDRVQRLCGTPPPDGVGPLAQPAANPMNDGVYHDTPWPDLQAALDDVSNRLTQTRLLAERLAGIY